MQLQRAVNDVFIQLSFSLDQLSTDQYCKPCANLSNSTIGQHVRHVIEMFQCLEKGYETGVVNYEKRNRDKQIEADRILALELLKKLNEGLAKQDRKLVLEGVYHDESSEPMRFQTNYYREVIYNLEHTIHHMALIRVGLRELVNVDLPESYGVASATVKQKKTCAQ